jgi:hypothetical protein
MLTNMLRRNELSPSTEGGGGRALAASLGNFRKRS